MPLIEFGGLIRHHLIVPSLDVPYAGRALGDLLRPSNVALLISLGDESRFGGQQRVELIFVQLIVRLCLDVLQSKENSSLSNGFSFLDQSLADNASLQVLHRLTIGVDRDHT